MTTLQHLSLPGLLSERCNFRYYIQPPDKLKITVKLLYTLLSPNTIEYKQGLMRSSGNAEAIKLIIQYPDSNKGTAAVETEIAQCNRGMLKHYNKPELSCRVIVAVSVRAKEYLQDTPTKSLRALGAERKGD